MIFITGDTHGGAYKGFKKLKELSKYNLTKDDYLIICGDIGIVWDGGNNDKYWQEWLSNKPYTVLFVDGNHENFDMLESYKIENWKGGKISKITDNIYHLKRGQVFTIDDKKIFTLGGATSIDKHNRTEGISWWKQEEPNDKELEEATNNLEKHNYDVDYIITHTCPEDIITELYWGLPRLEPSNLERYLQKVYSETKFTHWYCGHHHADKSYEHITLLYNRVCKLK